ncbi:MAG: hypothetical protein HGA67_04250 [Candidatus Yonathbacteria bacterium]|nr:hypothetical protein [Candidatus Yonathbacteria bacterium]
MDINETVRKLVYAGYTVMTVWEINIIRDRRICILGATECGPKEFEVSASSAVTGTPRMSAHDILPGYFIAIKTMPKTGFAHLDVIACTRA